VRHLSFHLLCLQPWLASSPFGFLHRCKEFIEKRFLISSGTITASKSTPFGSVHLDSGVGWLLFYELFALYWNCNFAMAFSQFVIASACSMWYFSHLGHDLSHPISKSIVRGLFHHSGSLALGSLILTFVGIVRFFLDQIHKAFKT
jgi:solute carrier family 44 (choline transporter-like protein), member 2/4/5